MAVLAAVSAPVWAQTVIFSSSEGQAARFRDDRQDVRKSTLATFEEDGETVYDVEVFKGDRSQYAVTLGFRTSAPVRKGDVMLATMKMKTLRAQQETGESAVYLYFQEASSPYSKSFIMQLGSDTDWTTFNIPFKAHRDFAPGEAAVEMALGSLSQHVLIKELKVLDYGPDMDIASLPQTRFTYPGREEDAAWRKEALERIEKIRTAPVRVLVRDARGKAVKGAVVNVKMVRSDFVWGTAISGTKMFHGQKLDSVYAGKLSEYFNTAILGNGLKAGGWFEPSRKESTLRTFKWLSDNGFRVRGHNLVWPAWKFNPRAARIIAQEESPEVFDRYVKAQFHERMAYTKGRVIAWDVVNEPMHEKEFFLYLPKGEDTMVDWFRLAKELDPDAQLFINEYAMLNCVQSQDNIRAYIDMIKDLRAKGAPIEAIGVQGHIGTQPRAPQLVISDLDLFEPLGLPVQITEWDINTKDEELQADYSRDFLIAVYSHPCVTGINMWGFWQADHWKPDAALFRTDWSEKPNAKVWRDLVLGKWKTDVTLKTSRTGEVSSRAHFGEYEISVSYKGREYKCSRHIGHDGLVLEVSL